VRVEWTVSVHERVQGRQFRQLTSQHFGMAAKVMHHDHGCLLLLREVGTLVEPSSTSGVHEEIGRPIQFNEEAARSRWHATGVFCRVPIFKGDIFDICERVFNFLASSLVVDVVCQASFVGGIEDH